MILLVNEKYFYQERDDLYRIKKRIVEIQIEGVLLVSLNPSFETK